MFTLRYSQEAKIVKWDRGSWTDCRPCEADGIQDEIIELASSLTVKPTLYKNVYDLPEKQFDLLPRSLDYERLPRKSTTHSTNEWTLEGANERAKRICQQAIDKSQNGYGGDLEHAKSVYGRYKEKGYLKNGRYAGLYDLENPTKENSWDDEPQPLSWGDEIVTDEMCTTKEDGTFSIVGKTALFADPYGAELFNVVQLVIKVEVVRSESEEKEAGTTAKDPTTSPVRKKAKET